MAEEKFIIGKKDDARHEGRASTVKRQQEVLNQLKELEESLRLPNRKKRWGED